MAVANTTQYCEKCRKIMDASNFYISKNTEKYAPDGRMNICKKCPLYKETPMGPICNPRLYINESDKKSVSDRPRIGYKRGCGCALTRKTRLPYAKCIVLK